MRAEDLGLAGAMLVHMAPHGDDRGMLTETYDARAMAAIGIDTVFVQDIHSVSAPVGTLRGLHYQEPPAAQAKLLRVLKGRILDVFLDIRHDSPTFGQHGGVELAGHDWKAIYIPIGFAHGFVTLEPNTEVAYKTSDHYAPELAKGIAWDDPALDIDWRLGDREPVLSGRDHDWPPFAGHDPAF